jgi:uncharacterized membrane protein
MSRNNFIAAVDIDAPPEKVFGVLCDVERWPEWTPTMTSVQRLDNAPFGVGSRAQVLQPRLRPAVWQVIELEDGRGFTWVTRAPGLHMKAGHGVERRGVGCRVELSFEMSGLLAPAMSLLYGAMIAKYVTTESQKLKQRCESAAA